MVLLPHYRRWGIFKNLPKKSHPYHKIHHEIQLWYQAHGRVTLPWRNTQNPYKIYLSEIMLQQTQVKTVLERFYFPFLKKFPTLKSVAKASLDDVLKAWEGLGYYTRARNLHKTAQETNGILPQSPQELERLSGIGKSTAHAVACFAFDASLPILDANVKRILYRFFAIEECRERELWERAYQLFDTQNAYSYNQAMMDIGSAICTHKAPNCTACPFHIQCQGSTNPLRYPKRKTQKNRPIRQRFILIYHHNDRYMLTQNKTRLLAGLWAFPQEEEYQLQRDDTLLGTFVHHYTHFTLKAQVVLIHEKQTLPHFEIEEIHQLALSGADRKALDLLKRYTH